MSQRVGCQMCDSVGCMTQPMPEADLHNLPCPECGEIGYMHAFPIPGTWPSEYDGCPAAPEAKPEETGATDPEAKRS